MTPHWELENVVTWAKWRGGARCFRQSVTACTVVCKLESLKAEGSPLFGGCCHSNKESSWKEGHESSYIIWWTNNWIHIWGCLSLLGDVMTWKKRKLRIQSWDLEANRQIYHLSLMPTSPERGGFLFNKQTICFGREGQNLPRGDDCSPASGQQLTQHQPCSWGCWVCFSEKGLSLG